MRTYLRHRVPGGTYFFTVNLAHRSDNRLLIEHIAALREAYRRTCMERPFVTIAAVVLPKHLHVVWRLPEGDDDYSTRWRLLKSRFSHFIHARDASNRSRLRKEEREIWQRRYWEHTIRDDIDLARRIDYVHYNPVKHGWCKAPTDWPFSSVPRHVRQGLLPGDWAGHPVADVLGR